MRNIWVTVLLTATLLTHSGVVWAQGASDTSWPRGSWHVAERLRPVLEESPVALETIVEAARAELSLRHAERARSILARHRVPASPIDPAFLPLIAAAEYQSENYKEAGEFFARAAQTASGARKGFLTARAGDAFERAGMPAAAALQYRAAAALLPDIANWLAVREARVSRDTAVAFALLRQAPREAQPLVARARAMILIAVADSARAATAFAEAGEPAVAAQLALALGGTEAARRYAYTALEHPDTGTVRAGLDIVIGSLPPVSASEFIVAAQARRRTGAPAAGAELARRAVAAGDSSAATFLTWAELAVEAERLRDALRIYEEIIALGGTGVALAKYRRARVLIRLRRRTEAYRALLRFAEQHRRHSLAPRALYLVADAQRPRSGPAADSLYRAVARRWPRDPYASRARLRLASLAIARRDSAEAMGWYQAEMNVRGAERNAAHYLLARLRARAGDSTVAFELWSALARKDSLGYYGTMARDAVRMPPPRFTRVPRRHPSPWVRAMLQQLDQLRASYLSEEADRLVGARLTLDAPADELLDLAEGLIPRGWVTDGVRLGWRAVRTRTLNDARVLRVIFPWPLRSLIEAEAAEYELDPYLLAALVRQESSFSPDATSRAGAIGLMQLMPSTAAEVARRLGIEWDRGLLGVADANLHVGAAHLAGLLRQYKGNVIPALAAYNAGGRPVARWLRYPEAGDPFLFVERIPYIETRGYLRTVLRNHVLYRALYPSQDPAVDGQ